MHLRDARCIPRMLPKPMTVTATHNCVYGAIYSHAVRNTTVT